jgi:hypothetical protein
VRLDHHQVAALPRVNPSQVPSDAAGRPGDECCIFHCQILLTQISPVGNVVIRIDTVDDPSTGI